MQFSTNPMKFTLPLIITSSVLISLGTSLAIYSKRRPTAKTTPQITQKEPLSPFAKVSKERPKQEPVRQPQSTPAANLPDPFHILLLGLDRRRKTQTSYRTDSIMIASISKSGKKVLLTSIPRDLWISGAKINAHYAGEGFDKFKERIGKVTGITPHSYISADFDAVVWAVDELGGAEPNIERAFTDHSYPDDRPGAPHPPNFQAGLQTLSGEETLQYCRSRKGTAGEGSDFRRMHRQQNLLVSLPKTFAKSNLVQLGAEALYNLITGHLETNLQVTEAAALLKILREYQNYKVEHLVLEPANFLYHPPSANYGGAYVLRPNGESFEAIHAHITTKLSLQSP